MKNKITIIVIFFLNIQFVNAQNALVFKSIDSLFTYSENNSTAISNGEQKTLLAKWQKISAQANLVNFRMTSNFSLTNNIELPVTYLPAEAFGGAAGTYKEVQMGQQYIGNLSFAPQIDLINPASWAKLKTAVANEQLTEVNNLIAKKMLFESISAAYFNIISLQEQMQITENSLTAADSILLTVQNKFTQGIVRQQDMNDAEINKLTLADKLNQLKTNLQIQYFNLKILCDLPENEEVIISEELNYNQTFETEINVNNQLLYEQSVLRIDSANADLNTNRLMQLPVVSLVYYDAWQQNSNDMFFDKNTDWTNSQYFGLKISVPFPDVNRYTSSRTAQIKRDITIENSQHSQLQNTLNNKQLILDYQQAISQLSTAQKIYELKKQNYEIAFNQYKMDILPTDKLLTAFNEMLTARMNYSIALANVNFRLSKININNSIQ